LYFIVCGISFWLCCVILCDMCYLCVVSYCSATAIHSFTFIYFHKSLQVEDVKIVLEEGQNSLHNQSALHNTATG
jgi:hypothetical protein